MERKQIEERLDHLAHYDHLTELPNRMLFMDRLRQALHLAEREKNHFTLMFIDLNDFKGVNDSYGHDVGDVLLKEFANRLSRLIRRSDTVARIGGDEFTVLLNNLGNAQQIMTLAQKIINETHQPFVIKAQEFNVGCSIGIAVYPEAGSDEETLQRHADLAMYQAKQEGVSSYRFYSKLLSGATKIQCDLHNDFYQAIASKQLGVFYMPRMNTQTKIIEAFDVLPYWRHPDKGILHYQYFANIFQDKGMGKKLMEWLLSVGLHQWGKIQPCGHIKLAFRFDYAHFSNAQFP